MIRRFVLGLLLCAVVSGESRAQHTLENLLSPALLPQLKEGRLLQLSSNDTSGENSDFVAIPPGETAVIADIRGPGVIVGMWFTIMSPDKHFLRRLVLRAYWDGEQHPSVEVPVGDFFGTGFAYKHYLTPFLGMSSGGYYCYFPMPFARSARMEIVNETGQEVQSFYYHINYRQLPAPPATSARAGSTRSPVNSSVVHPTTDAPEPSITHLTLPMAAAPRPSWAMSRAGRSSGRVTSPWR